MDVNFICKISNIESAYYSISVYETPYCTAENAEYTAIGLGENTGTLSFASDAYYYSSGDGYYNAKFLKVSLKAGETYNINYQLSKKAKGAYGLAPYIAIDGESSYSNSTGFADSCSVLTITITPEADGDCKIAIWNEYGGPIPCEYDYKLTIRQLDKASGLASLDCSTEYTVGSVISGSLNADDKQVYCNNDYYGYAEGYSVNVPDDGNKYAFFFKEGSDNTFKKASVVLFKKAFSDAPLAHTEGFPDPIFLSSVVSAGQYKLALMSDQMNSADYKFAIRKVATQPSDIDFSRKLTVGKSQSEYADPFSTQPFSPSESFFAYCSGYSVELEKGVTYRFSTTAKDVSSELALFAEGDMNTPLQYVMSNYDDETNTYSAEFSPVKTGTYKLLAQFARGSYGFVDFCTPVKYMVEEVSSLADLLNNATELTGTHTAQLDFSKDAQLFDSGLESVGMLLGKAYKMSLAEGEMLMENWTDDLGYLWFHKDAEGKFQMSDLNSSSENFYYTADADTVLYFVLAVQPNVSNENVTMSGFVCKPIEQLLDSAVEVAQLPYTASGMFNVLDKGAQMCVCPSGVPSGGFCGAYKLNIAKGEYVNYSFEASAVGFYFVYSKVDGEYVMPDFFSGGGVKIGGYDKDTTFYMANVINGTMSPYKVAINNDNAITLFELFNGATEIGTLPFYAEGNSAQNSTLTNIREYIALPNTWNEDSDRFTYANAYKLKLTAGESVCIDYSSTVDAYMLLYSKNSSGEYEFIDYKNDDNYDDSFYGNGENYDYTASADMDLYIYVAPYGQLTQTNWAFNVLKKQQIKTPGIDAITLTELFDGATEIGDLPFYAEGNSAQNSTLVNIREYTALPYTWNYDYDYFTYANAYKLSLKAGESVRIDYSSTEDAYMLLYSKNSSGGYELIDYNDNGNDGSFYGDGEYYDFTAESDMELYIYVAPYNQFTQTNWAFNVVMDEEDIKTPDIDAITLTELFDGATEIGNLPFYAEGNSADNSTLTNIRECWGSDCITYANAYKLKLTAGESVCIDYSSTVDAYMLLYSKNSSGEYEFIDYKDDGNDDSFYGNGEYYDFTAPADMELYIYVAPYGRFTQTDWAFNVVVKDEEVKVPSADLTLADLLDSATEVDMNALRTDGYAMFIGGATELYNTSNYIPWANNLTTTAVAYKFLVPAGANVNLYNLKSDDYEGFYFRKTANGYKYCDWSEKLMRDSAGDTLYVVSLNYAPSTYDYMHVLQVYENVTELKYPDLMFEQEPTKEDVMVALFENNPYFVNCFGDTVVISMDEIERNGDINGYSINMANHTVTYHVSYNTSISSPMDRYRYNISEITARFGVPFTLAVSTTGNGTVNSNVSGKYLKDTEVVISAVPAEHYHFVQWSNGSLKATDTILVVSDTALVAEFAIDTYNVELTAENGTVTGAGEYGYGSAVKIVATPAEGFHFVQWSNGSLKANDTITVVSDTALVATFEAHSFGEWDTTLVATCTVAGSRTRTCACGASETEKIDSLGHTVVVDSAVAATCTTAGLTEGKHCSACDSIFVAQQTVPALGHKIVTIAGVSPTCTAEGLTEGSRCSVCGEVIVAQETIPMLEHSFTNYIYNNDATTEADGTETAVCDHGCGAADTRTAEGTKLTGIDAMETAEVVIYAHHNVIVVENAETDIYVYEPTGRCVAKRQAESNRIEITMPNQGLYIVKVGAEAKRVFINKN